MPAAQKNKQAPSAEQTVVTEMATYGITHVPVDYYHFRGFRYTSLKEAITQAKRMQPHG